MTARSIGVGRQFHRLPHQIERLARAHAADAGQPLEVALQLFAARDHADVGDRTPANGKRRQPFLAPAAGEPFHIGVGGDVVALAGIADHGRHRREQHEIVERLTAGGQIEIFSAGDFRRQHAVEPVGIEILDDRVVENHRGVDDADNRRHCGLDFFEQPFQGAQVGNVAWIGDHLDAALGNIAQNRLGFGARGAAATDQDKVASAAVDQPFDRFQTETAKCAGHDVGAVGADHQRLIRRAYRARLRRPHHDFSDVARVLHQLERFGNTRRLKHAVRQGLEPVIAELRHHLRIDFCAEQRPPGNQLIQIDPEIAQVLAERPQANVRIGHVIPLAEFDETPERAQARD